AVWRVLRAVTHRAADLGDRMGRGRAGGGVRGQPRAGPRLAADDADAAARCGSRRSPARLLRDLHQLVQRVARGDGVRAGAELRLAVAGPARHRLSQSGRGPLAPAAGPGPDGRADAPGAGARGGRGLAETGRRRNIPVIAARWVPVGTPE